MRDPAPAQHQEVGGWIDSQPMSSHWMPAQPGDALADIDTPALILDLDRFEANVARMMEVAADAGVRVRPHAKAHKSLQIAHRQIAAGAVGICCQKIGEAEVFLGGGIRDVLITNEVVGARKLRRLAQLAKIFSSARIGVCVDDISVVRQLSMMCAEEDARLDVYIELDVGQNRAGVADAGRSCRNGTRSDAAPASDADGPAGVCRLGAAPSRRAGTARGSRARRCQSGRGQRGR